MPKILQINSVVNTGSTGRIAEQLGLQAIGLGWKSYIAYGRESRNSQSKLIRVCGKMDVGLHVVGSMLMDRHGLFCKSATKRFLRQVDEIKPDVVHLHNIHGYYVNVPMLLEYLREKDIPTVITIHDFWLMTGHCAYINPSCYKWQNGCGKCPRLNQYPAAKLDHSSKNWMWKAEAFKDMKNVTIVPVSYWLEGFAKRSLLSDCNFHVIQNGVDVKLFQPYKGKHTKLWKKIDWSKYTIITVADRWTDANGYNDIIALSRMLPDDMQIVMVGLNGQQLERLPKKIVGIGHTDNVQQLIELYTSADVLFNASIEVTFGLVTAEAMACGTPAIVFKNTAGEEIIDSETGYTIECIDEISALVRKCRENAEFYKLACRKRIVENFDSVRQYSKYVTLYNELLQGK